MKIFAIINPSSGTGENEDIIRLIESSFIKDELNVCFVSSDNTAISIAKTALESNAECILVAGGDGTVTEVISVIVNTDIKLGIVPVGTGNLLAINLGIPLDIKKSLEIIKSNNTQKIDVGIVNGRYFTLITGCGFDSKIIGLTDFESKKRFGAFAYIITAFREIFKTKIKKFEITLDSQQPFRVKATSVMIANTAKIIGEAFSLAPKASLYDGKLDLIVFSSMGFWDISVTFFQMILGRHYESKAKLKYYQAKDIKITGNKKYFIQADGDMIGATPIEASIIPSALNVYAPQNANIGSTEMIQRNLNILLANVMKSMTLRKY